jgi:PPOX class probable F420-dependent enzyme
MREKRASRPYCRAPPGHESRRRMANRSRTSRNLCSSRRDPRRETRQLLLVRSDRDDEPVFGDVALHGARWHRYGLLMRTNLAVEDLDGFLDEPLVAVLATLRADGSVLLSPVWHEWRDGGFNVWVEADKAKARHLRRDARATIVVAESEAPLRGVEVRGSARFIEEGVTEIARRIAARYIGEEDAAADAEALRGADVVVRIEPGALRVWDFAGEYDTG